MHRRFLARISRRRPAITDDQIYWALRAAEEGRDPADLCAAIGATIPTFCVWKTKYAWLTLEELRSVRHEEAARARVQRVALAAGVVLAIGSLLLLARLGTVADTNGEGWAPVSASEPPPADAVEAVQEPMGGSQPAAVLPASATVAPAPVAAPRAAAVPNGPSAPDQYAVQVAAMPDRQLAQRLADALAGADYPAYVLPTVVGDAEVFRVRVGPFGSRPAANEVLVRLERDGYRGAWVAR